MKTSSRADRMRIGPVLWTGLFGLELLLSSAAPAWSQRRRAEPEASPQFQDQGQQPSGGGEGAGGPIGGSGGASEAESSAEPQQPSSSSPEAGPAEGMPEPSPSMKSGREIRVGASSSESAAPPAPTNPLETRIVVRVKNAPLATFLDTISAQAKVNFIITEGLETKRITAFLQNVTVREALQILLEIKGLTYQRIGRSNTYVVSRRAKDVPNRITRIYTLNHIPLVPITAGTRDFTPLSGSSGGSSGGSSSGSSYGGGGGQGQQGLTQDVVAIIDVLKTVLTKEYGKVGIDARTNSLIITDLPEVFPQIEQILAELDKKAPQVMIEAQIVEINSDRAQQLGLEWGGVDGQLASFTGPMRDTTFPLNLPKTLNNVHFFDPIGGLVSGVGASGSSGGSSGSSGSSSSGSSSLSLGNNLFQSLLQTGVIDLTSLKVVLRALVNRAEARFLGKPKVLTLNNKQAVIQISQSQAVALQQVQSGSTGGTSTNQVTVERYSTGLTLRVIPQVNSEGYITLLVEPSYTNIMESQISSSKQPVFDPESRGASTLVRVKNSQTLVLGGLLESRETKTVRKVPFLGYIPLIGWLFTSTSNQRTNTDLVIFITPTIVTD